MKVSDAVTILKDSGLIAYTMRLPDESEDTISGRLEWVNDETESLRHAPFAVWQEDGKWIAVSMSSIPIAVSSQLSNVIRAVININKMRWIPPNSPNDFWGIERCLVELYSKAVFTVIESPTQMTARISEAMPREDIDPAWALPFVLKAERAPLAEKPIISFELEMSAWHVQINTHEAVFTTLIEAVRAVTAYLDDPLMGPFLKNSPNTEEE